MRSQKSNRPKREKVGKSEWPPPDARRYIQSNAFGDLLLAIAELLLNSHPRLDFTDSVAQVFTWFDDKLEEEPNFINSKRFPSLSRFKAYIRQSVWNAALLAERKRQRRREISALPSEIPILSHSEDPVALASLHEKVEGLPEPQKSIFERVFFDEEEIAWVASCLGKTEQEVQSLYEEAIDLLDLSDC